MGSRKKAYIFQQKGHHPEYNMWATEKVKSSIKGLRGKNRQAAFQSAVGEIASIVEKRPTFLLMALKFLLAPMCLNDIKNLTQASKVGSISCTKRRQTWQQITKEFLSNNA